MNLKFNAYLIISLLIFSMLPTPIVLSAPPIQYNKELYADSGLTGAFFTNDNADGFHVSFYGDNAISISSINHYTDKTIKIKGTALTNRLKMYNGLKAGITHINDDGTKDFYVKDLEIDNQGFAYLTTDFSTVIINGMTGTTTYTLTNQSGNWSTVFDSADVSSIEADITNWDAELYTINGTDFTNRRLLTLNPSVEDLTDFEVKKVQDYYSPMQVDMDDRLYTVYGNDTLIPFWDEDVVNSTNATNWLKIPSISTTEGAQVWMYYGNSGISSTSSIFDTGMTGSDDFSGNLLLWTETDSGANVGIVSGELRTMGNSNWGTNGVYSTTTFTKPFILEFRKTRNSAAGSYTYWGLNDGIGTSGSAGLVIEPYSSTSEYYRYRNGALADVEDWVVDQNYHLKFVIKNSGYEIYRDGNLLETDTTWVQGVNTKIAISQYGSAGYGYADDVFIHKYTATELTWAADDEEQTTGTTNFTLKSNSITNTTAIGTGNTSTLTVSPTTADLIYINTTCTDWGATVTKYWTEDTTLIEETVASGYVKQYINYTPSANITSANLNTTVTNDLTAHDCLGTITSTLNDVSKTTTRDGQEVNASVGSLTKGVAYYWNVTIPYNNIPTVGVISNQTAYIGVSKSFTAPSYSDPEGLPIDTHYWQFDDGNTSSDQNPTHIYTTAGLRNANYTVTETATISPQVVLRGFTVDVGVQPPQNVTTVPQQMNVSIDWDDYISADKYSVYELEDGIPYVTTNPTVDGVKDAIYDSAHEFLIYSPNPGTPGDYETSYPIRTALGAYFFHEAVDNDDKLGDDDLIYYFDTDNDGLTVDDPAWKITNNIVKKYLWNGATWQVTGVSSAVGESTGGGSHNPKHELFIPVAELGANWTNGSTVKVLAKREDSSLSPDVVTWYPYGNINDTDTSLWKELVLNQPNTYDLLANVTPNNYTALNLTPFTIYHGAVSAWNGTDESDYTLFDVITDDVPVYNVSGYVFDDLGDTIAGATVWSQNGYVAEITTSDANGYYIGCNFRVGNYSIYANKTGYAQNFTDVYVTENLTNINVTLPRVEDPREMLSNTYNLLLLILGACFILAFPKRGEVTERDTGLNNVLFSFLGTILAIFLAQIIVSGQVIESFAFESPIYDPLQHYLLYLFAVIMFVVFALNIVYYIRQRVDL